MAAVPITLLLLGSLVLGLWRPADARQARLTEAGFTGAALVTSLFVRRSIPSTIGFAYLAPSLSSSASVKLDLSPWSWSLLVAALGFAFAQTVLAGPRDAEEGRVRSSGWLAYAAVVALSILAANTLTLILAWALVISAQAWLVKDRGSPETSPWGFLSSLDLAALVCLLAAQGLLRGGSSELPGPTLAYALLLGAGLVRLASGLAAGERAVGKRDALRLGGLTAVSVLAMLSLDFGAKGAQALDGWLVVLGAGLLFWAGASWWLAPPGELRWPAWALAMTGAATLTAGASQADAPSAFAAAGAVLVLAQGMASAGASRTFAGRIGSILATATTAGIPFLVGALLLGVLAVAGEPGGAAPIRWVGVLGVGALSSRFLYEALFPMRGGPAGQPASVVGFLALVVTAVLAAALFAYLRTISPLPSTLAVVVCLAAAAGGTAVLRVVPIEGRSRLVRSLRWPSSLDISRLVRGLEVPMGAAARGVRDLLEGDASLLWAFVVLLIGFLLLRGST